jgi:hypothetical protein
VVTQEKQAEEETFIGSQEYFAMMVKEYFDQLYDAPTASAD